MDPAGKSSVVDYFTRRVRTGAQYSGKRFLSWCFLFQTGIDDPAFYSIVAQGMCHFTERGGANRIKLKLIGVSTGASERSNLYHEAHAAVRSMNAGSAPGPDGFSRG